MVDMKTRNAAKRKKRIKRSIIFIIVILIIFVPIFVFKKEKTGKQDLPPLAVKKEKSYNRIEISGYIEAAQQQILESPGEGIIQKVSVKEGDTVKAGQLIFTLDSTKEQYNLADQEFAMNQEKINGASQKLKLMQQQYEMLKKQLDDRSVVAQFSGIVVGLKISQGQYAKPKDNFGTLIDRTYLKATVQISESDASRLQVGQKVRLTFPAEPDLEVEGKVTSYPAIARVTDTGRTIVDTNIRVDNPPEKILPGYSFNGTIVAGEDTESLVLSQDGIRYEKGEPFADKILEGGKTEAVAVTVAPYTHGFVKILSGLQEGDQVANQGAQNKNEQF
ncbi:efflux RND transporter periplasmic adaptor subunit [Treponema phagedenis]|uniref:efflux RND transporter periplasmic adaptor subunit n=1 Tax=Treponema phagedenis TaxID=162 RepID=UPI0001F639FE|nr:efflux RND transporter periplasmic adaptor subunit [Treponema phagedenis]EFW39221.1 efflux transporter, RND family, MFP subunit [Treponema phagedenis F0421]TYT78117.1 efflux RND transporter periplasmic adaptor subunit [Treponema phagedenis]